MKHLESFAVYPVWEIEIASTKPIGGKYVLTKTDRDRLASGMQFAAKLDAALPVDVEAAVTLCLPWLQIYLVPSDMAPANFTMQDCARIADEVVIGLARVACECRANAAAAKPLPLEKSVSAPGLVPVLKALAGNGKKSTLLVSYSGTQGSCSLPAMTPADFTAGAEDSKETIFMDRRALIALIHNRRDKVLALLLQDVKEFVLLPEDWTWEQMKEFLNTETFATGKLTREGDVWRFQKDVVFEPKLV